MNGRIVLVGPPGAGVDAVAEELGRRLDAAVRHTDADVESRAGASVSEIFVEVGEDRFRELERDAVVAALAEHDGVLALGGGAVMDPRTEADLAGERVVFLDVSISQAARTLGFTGPTTVINPRAQWLRMMETRRPVYERVADVVVAVDGKAVTEVVEEILAAL